MNRFLIGALILWLAAANALSAAGFDVSLHISPGTAHGIAPDGLDFATGFLIAHAAHKP